MTKFLTTTTAQSAGGIIALDLAANVDPASVKTQLIAIAGSLVVTALKWAFFKFVKPVFEKKTN